MRVILYSFFAKEQGYKFVRVKSSDTDIFFICLYFANMLEGMQIIFDTGRGNKKQLINVTKIAEQCTQEYCTALMAIYAYTRCDTTSAFKGIRKAKPIKVIQKMPKFQKGWHSLVKHGMWKMNCLQHWKNLHAYCMEAESLQT